MFGVNGSVKPYPVNQLQLNSVSHVRYGTQFFPHNLFLLVYLNDVTKTCMSDYNIYLSYN